MSKYFITINNIEYDLANLIDTTGTEITTLYGGFPNSSTPTCNLEKLLTNTGILRYSENTTDLSNKCKAKSYTSTFTFTSPFNTISGILASGGGGGGGGGPTINADTGNNNDSGGGGGGGGKWWYCYIK